jgi:hypothetical protein
MIRKIWGGIDNYYIFFEFKRFAIGQKKPVPQSERVGKGYNMQVQALGRPRTCGLGMPFFREL